MSYDELSKRYQYHQKTLAPFFNDGAHKVFIYGSRASGTAYTYSDYDIGLVGPRLPADKYFDIVAEFEESNLPVKVDLVQMCDVSFRVRNVIRDAARLGLVSDPSVWFSYGEARNKTSHIYREEIALEVYRVARGSFLNDVDALIKNLSKLTAP